MGVLHSVGSRGAVQLDRYYGAVSRERVADLDTETSRNGGLGRILVAGMAGSFNGHAAEAGRGYPLVLSLN